MTATATTIATYAAIASARTIAAATLTPPELAREWRVDVGKVLDLIKSGQLKAFNCAVNPRGRPRYRIRREDVTAFESQRSPAAAAKPATAPRTKRKSASDDFVKYY